MLMTPPSPPSERELEPPRSELDQLKGLFLASLNHEIRTPLSGIMGMADLLLETNLDDEQREYVNAARLCAESLFEILNATLEYSSLEAGQFHLDESEFSLKEMLDSAVNQHALRAQAKGLRLFSTFEAGLPETMLGDAPRLRELLGYMISNAIKFTHAGTVELRVTLDRLAADGNWIVVEVRDTGIGIPADRLDAIFESFQQVDAGLSRSYPGLGLGLALVRKLAALMNGRVEVESTLEKGSTFTVRLPVRQAASSAQESVLPVRGVRPTILAVEDNPVGLTVLRHALARRSVEVHCAMSGAAALEAAAKRRYDLVLMDLQMPEMDGLETTRRMRTLPGYETVPILALTANSSDEIRARCLLAGMQAFLSKPVEAAELWALVSKFLKAAA
jgi:CheY-like chemotaxis protein/anti-sigma regulatory factor (Ser/Thr protein kinase)